jgi:tRNA uridine 5-carboxymethylaminomethyl modification enzyme
LQLGFTINPNGVRRSAFDLLSHNDVTLQSFNDIAIKASQLYPRICERFEIEGKYAAWIIKELADVAAVELDENLILPQNLDYHRLGEY